MCRCISDTPPSSAPDRAAANARAERESRERNREWEEGQWNPQRLHRSCTHLHPTGLARQRSSRESCTNVAWLEGCCSQPNAPNFAWADASQGLCKQSDTLQTGYRTHIIHLCLKMYLFNSCVASIYHPSTSFALSATHGRILIRWG